MFRLGLGTTLGALIEQVVRFDTENELVFVLLLTIACECLL